MSFAALYFPGLLMLLQVATFPGQEREPIFNSSTPNDAPAELLSNHKKPNTVAVTRDVLIGEYFPYMDSVILRHADELPYPLTEHLLVHYNPWIIDSLSNTDYYRMMQRDSFVYDQREMVALPMGSKLFFPDSTQALAILQKFDQLLLDVNIPEFRLRIYNDSVLLHSFPVRVGQNRRRFLAMADREIDLRTKTGRGKIIRHIRNPDFYDPVDGRRFYLTKRDDGKTTCMPLIPWIETEINGVRNGQMIHPTTNPETLEKAYSNGCIGIREADAWIIYYYAPIDTRLNIRYNLSSYRDGRLVQRFKDIYGYQE